jgi:hypothetical protein
MKSSLSAILKPWASSFGLYKSATVRHTNINSRINRTRIQIIKYFIKKFEDYQESEKYIKILIQKEISYQPK